jgi:flagellar motor protein MotB
MLAAVQALLRERQVEVSLDPANGILRLPESLLFDSAHAVLRPDGARALRELAAVLARTLPCYSLARPVQQIDCAIAPKPLLEAVLVEGHTDDVPIATPQFEDNWQLASTRHPVPEWTWR